MIDVDKLNKIAYFGDAEDEMLGMVSVYHVYVNDNLVAKAKVQIEDDKEIIGTEHNNCFPIWVTTFDDQNATSLGQYHAKRKTDNETGKVRISSDSVKSIIGVLLVWILAELYVPQN